MVGIFWMAPDLDSFFYTISVELAQGIRYTDWIIANENHSKVWDDLLSKNELVSLPKRYWFDYTLLPRGRVSYRCKNKEYVIYHGNWLKERHKKMIVERYRLSDEKYQFEIDNHYVL